jgi:hypothetical protein
MNCHVEFLSGPEHVFLHPLHVGWRDLSKTAENSSSSPRAAGVFGNGCVMCCVSDLLLRWEIIFGVTYKLKVKNKMGYRHRYSEGRNDRQMMTPRGYPKFNSYVKNLCVLVFRTDRRTDRWRNTSTAHGLEKLFSAVLERFLQPTRSGCTRRWTCDVLLCQFFGCGRK